MNSKQYFITTNDDQRSRMWERLFGVNRLPVLHGRARWQPVHDRDTYAYDLHLSRLSAPQLDRFAAYVARRTQRRYEDVRIELGTRSAYPIPARGCNVEIEENETAVNERPFFNNIRELLQIVKTQYRMAIQ